MTQMFNSRYYYSADMKKGKERGCGRIVWAHATALKAASSFIPTINNSDGTFAE
jgi:hypothetical protein